MQTSRHLTLLVCNLQRLFYKVLVLCADLLCRAFKRTEKKTLKSLETEHRAYGKSRFDDVPFYRHRPLARKGHHHYIYGPAETLSFNLN